MAGLYLQPISTATSNIGLGIAIGGSVPLLISNPRLFAAPWSQPWLRWLLAWLALSWLSLLWSSDARFGVEQFRACRVLVWIPLLWPARNHWLWLVAALLGALALTPLPALPLLSAAALVVGAAIWTSRVRGAAQGRASVRSEPERIEEALSVDPISIELGMGLLSLAGEGPSGVLSRVATVRRRLAQDLGVLVPAVRVRDDAALDPNSYCIRLRDAVVAAGTLRPGMLLAMDPRGGEPDVAGERTREPAHGLPAVWVASRDRGALEARGLAMADAGEVLAGHLLETLRRRAWDLLGIEEVGRMIDRLRASAPRAADLVSGPEWPIRRVRDLLQTLLREGLPVRDLERIAEAVHDANPRDPDDAVRRARAVSAGALCERLLQRSASGQRQLEAVWVGADSLEGDAALRAAERSVVPDAAIAERLVRSAAPGLRRLLERGAPAVVVTPDRMRGVVSRALRGRLGEVTVLAQGEIPQDCDLQLESAGESAGA